MKKLWNQYSYAIILVILSIVASFILAFRSSESVEDTYMNITIGEGQTVWDLCKEYANKHSLTEEEFISWVEEINDINGNKVRAGEKIYIPVELKNVEITELASK